MFSLSLLWDRTTAFIADHLGAILPVAVLGLFLPTAALQSLMPFAAGHPPVVPVLFVCGLASAWAQLVLIALSIDPAAGKTGAIRLATRRFPTQLGIGLLVGVMLLVALLPFGIAIGLAAAARGVAPTQNYLSNLPTGVVLFLLGYALLFVVAMVWLGARILPWSAVVLAERRGLRAITRAFRLTRGATFKLVGLILLYVVVAQVAQLAVTAVIGTVFGLFLDAPLPLILSKIAAAVVGTVFGVIAAIYIGQLYLALRDRTDGTLDLR